MKKQVTVEEARKILGDDANEMSDEKIQELVDHLSVMAKWALEEAARIRTKEKTKPSSRGKNDSTEL